MKRSPRIAFIRGSYANPFELQSYSTIATAIPFTVISSQKTIAPVHSLALWSPADISSHWIFEGIARRFGGSQYLMGLTETLKNFDVIHTADPYYPYSYQASKTGKPLIVTYWETRAHMNESIWAMRKIKYAVLQHAHTVLCYTKKSKQAVIDEGVDRKKVVQLYPAVDTLRFTPSYKRGKYTLLFVGRLVPEKGIAVLLQAFKMAREVIPNLKLRVIGKGPLESLCRTYGAEVGTRRYSDIVHEYHRATCMVVSSLTTPTWEEQFGMVLLEAMATATPLIATQSGAIGEVAQGVARFVPENDPQALSHAIVTLIESESERSKRATMGIARTRTVFSLTKFTKNVLALYEKAYRNHSRT